METASTSTATNGSNGYASPAPAPAADVQVLMGADAYNYQVSWFSWVHGPRCKHAGRSDAHNLLGHVVGCPHCVPDTPPACRQQVKDGVKKANTPALKTFILGLYAGAYIAFGGFLSMTVVNACPGV